MERIDDLQIGNLKIIQDTSGFCFGTDAVLLSKFVRLKRDSAVLDLCTGTGIIPILLSAQNMAKRIDGIEIIPKIAEMAKRSVSLNGLDNLIKIHTGDIKDAPKMLYPRRYDVITCNPPYMHAGVGLINPDNHKAVSRHEILCTLEDVISVSSKLLNFGGRFYMVHRAERMVDVLCTMRQFKIEPKRLRMVYPSPEKSPDLFLIEGISGGKKPLKVLPSLYVNEG